MKPSAYTTPNAHRAELHHLAAEQREKVVELVSLCFADAGSNGAFPLDDRSPLRQ